MRLEDRDVTFNDRLHLLLSTPKNYKDRNSLGFSMRNSSNLKIVQYAAYESYEATKSVYKPFLKLLDKTNELLSDIVARGSEDIGSGMGAWKILAHVLSANCGS